MSSGQNQQDCPPSRVTYVSKVQELLSKENHLGWDSRIQRSSSTQVSYIDMNCKTYETKSPADLISQSAVLKENGMLSICVIENISGEYLETLGSGWDIDPKFFAAHATNPDKDKLWEYRFWEDRNEDRKTPDVTSDKTNDSGVQSTFLESCMPYEYLSGDSGHLDGIFEYEGEINNLNSTELELLSSSSNFIHRHCFKDGQWPVQTTTRISYCRLNAYMYLFLVDAPLNWPHLRGVPTLRLRYSTNRGGLQLPHLLPQNRYSLFKSLESFLQHQWHFKVLFDFDRFGEEYTQVRSRNIMPIRPLLYLLSSSLWEENLRRLTREIKDISFRQLRNPSLGINDILHDKRKDLAWLKGGLMEITIYTPKTVTDYFQKHENSPNWRNNWRNNPTQALRRTLSEALELEELLKETFQLFMSSLSVQDSRASIEQSRRASRLTTLAFIYVPLSFVTGVFGMNIQEINSSGLRIWVCFVALAVVVLLTIGVFWAVKVQGDRRDARRHISEV